MNSKWPSASVSAELPVLSSVILTPAIGFLVKRSMTRPSKFTCGPSFTICVLMANA